MHLYETAIVFDSQSKSEEIEDRINNVNQFITNHGGKITGTVEVGKKRLAYEINKKQYGYYVYVRFTGPGQLISLLEREYRLNESILRYLTLKVDKKQIHAEEKAAEQIAAKAAQAAASAKTPEPATEKPEEADTAEKSEAEAPIAATAENTGAAAEAGPDESAASESAQAEENASTEKPETAEEK